MCVCGAAHVMMDLLVAVIGYLNAGPYAVDDLDNVIYHTYSLIGCTDTASREDLHSGIVSILRLHFSVRL